MGKGKRGPEIPDQDKIAKAGVDELGRMRADLEQQRAGERAGNQKFQKLEDALRAVRRALEAKGAGGDVHQAVAPQSAAPKTPEPTPTRSPSPQKIWEALRAKAARALDPKAPPASKPPVAPPGAQPAARAPYSPPAQTTQGTSRGATGDFGLFDEFKRVAEEDEVEG